MTMQTTTIDLASAKADLDTQGFYLIEGALSAEQLAVARSRLLDQAAQERAEGWGLSYDRDSQAVQNLLNKGAVFADLALARPVLDLIEHLLGTEVLLSSITANIVGPGTKAQTLHADQAIVPAPWPGPWVANVAWMLDDFTPENGATCIVAGTHLTNTNPDYTKPLPKASPVIAPAGTAMVFDGRLWHGAGENTSTARRHAIFAYYCAPFLRQQENMFLSLGREVVENAPPELRKLLGYVPYYGKIGAIPR